MTHKYSRVDLGNGMLECINVLVLLSVRWQGEVDRKKAIAQDKRPPVNKQRLVQDSGGAGGRRNLARFPIESIQSSLNKQNQGPELSQVTQQAQRLCQESSRSCLGKSV